MSMPNKSREEDLHNILVANSLGFVIDPKWIFDEEIREYAQRLVVLNQEIDEIIKTLQDIQTKEIK